MDRFQPAQHTTTFKDFLKTCRDAEPGISKQDVQRLWKENKEADYFINDTYLVMRKENAFTPVEGTVYLSVRRLDREPVHDWREMQEIKNQLVGPECEGFEIYPAESRLVDTANQYHLFVFADPEYRLPFGFGDRAVSDKPVHGTKQRSL